MMERIFFVLKKIFTRKEKVVFGVDLDDTLGKTTEVIIKIVKEECGVSLLQNDRKSYGYPCWDNRVSDEEWQKILSEFHEKKIMFVEPIPCAACVLNCLKDFIDIHIVTARNKKIKKETAAWLKKNKIPYKKIIFSEQKDEKKYDFFVEDNPKTAYSLAEKGTTVFLIDYPHNRPIDGDKDPKNIIRVKDWTELADELWARLLEKK